MNTGKKCDDSDCVDYTQLAIETDHLLAASARLKFKITEINGIQWIQYVVIDGMNEDVVLTITNSVTKTYYFAIAFDETSDAKVTSIGLDQWAGTGWYLAASDVDCNARCAAEWAKCDASEMYELRNMAENTPMTLTGVGGEALTCEKQVSEPEVYYYNGVKVTNDCSLNYNYFDIYYYHGKTPPHCRICGLGNKIPTCSEKREEWTIKNKVTGPLLCYCV